jgi:hypothetical protein
MITKGETHLNERTKRRDFALFIAASAILGVSQSVDSAAYNNFLNDTFQISVMQRTLIEIPRELPGFMVVFIAGFLLFLGDRRMAAIANIAAGFGMLMLGWFSPMLGIAVLWTFLYSAGQHMYMPLTNSIGMGFSDNAGIGRRLGMIGSVNTAVLLCSNIIIFFTLRQLTVTKATYTALFTVGAGAFVLSGLLIAFMTKPKRQPGAEAPREKQKRFVFRKEYRLFYALSVVYGARKQIFITFGPWVLIKVFEQGVGTFALLGFAIAGGGMLLRPLIGWCIDKKGERFVLMCDALILIVVCMGYGYAETLAGWLGVPSSWALAVVCGCFVGDQLLTGTSIARATYLRKVAVKEADVPLQLSMGVSMDHVVSMIIPFCGAFLWDAAGYSPVFLGGAVIACVNLCLALRIKTA